jgi:glyoxylase-like metal-dependent hydrolase (beta-lactamase superfamily II)
MLPIKLGTIEVRRVEEMIWTVSPRFLFPQLTYEDFEKHRAWLVPHFSTEDLKFRLSMHTFVLRTLHHTILVDTCIGNCKQRSLDAWNNLNTGYLDNLRTAGIVPGEVDYVFCTHMHVDHVGWNSRLDNGRWIPTFPNAKYLFHRTEWEHWQHTTDPYQAPVVQDSLLPVVDAGLAEIVDSDYVIEDGIRLLPTPGHTPGHCSVLLGAGSDADAVITGDMIHHPSQIAEPQWPTRACSDPQLAVKTRTDFVQRYADTPTLILGTHFSPPTALRIVSSTNGLGICL